MNEQTSMIAVQSNICPELILGPKAVLMIAVIPMTIPTAHSRLTTKKTPLRSSPPK